jgi:hypothetical protein
MVSVARGCVVAVLGLTVFGCATQNEGAKRIPIVSNPSYVADCTAIGNISGDALYGGDPAAAQKAAADLKADKVLAVGGIGVAYRCPK